jgi:2-methylisocitrate lyase-like PEP mutase family enzyme
MGGRIAGMSDLAARASELLRLHHTGTTLVLPTVWDAWSARAVVEAGFAALSIGSHPLADSRGQRDNEGMSLDDALDGIRRITGAVDVPVTADVESGYDTAAAELVDRVLDAGAVGVNVEDTVHSQKRLRDVQEHADYIGAIRAAADAAGIDLVVNARTDAFIGTTRTFDDPLAEAVRRLKACEAAGARCVYPVRVPDADTLRALLRELDGPVNVTAHPVNGAPSGSFDELKAMGVHRITFGPLLQAALTEKLAALVDGWH